MQMSQAAVIQPPKPRRSRHWAWREAHDRTKQCAFKPNQEIYEDAWGQAPEILKLAEIYKSAIQDKAIVLSNSCDDRVLVLPYYTRFSEGYYPEKARELRRLINFDDATFLTLTVDPHRFSCLFDAKRALSEGWAKLRDAMDKDVERNTGHVVGWDKNFIAVPEFQESGNPHLHVLLKDCRWIDVDWLRNLWEAEYGVGTFVHVERVHGNRKKVINYLLKYLFKGANNGRHLALLWALNARAFSCSLAILDNQKTKCDKLGVSSECQWFLVGIYPLAICKDLKTKADLLSFLDT